MSRGISHSRMLLNKILNSFSASSSADFSTAEEEQFINPTSDLTMRLQFKSVTWAAFWITVRKDYCLDKRACGFCHILPMWDRIIYSGLNIDGKGGYWEWSRGGSLGPFWQDLQHIASPQHVTKKTVQQVFLSLDLSTKIGLSRKHLGSTDFWCFTFTSNHPKFCLVCESKYEEYG